MLGQSLLLIWDNFMGQGAAGIEMLGRIASTQFTLHHFIGTVTQFNTGSGSLKIISSFFARYNNTKLATSADLDSASFTSAVFLQSLEGSAAQQVNGIQSADAIAGVQIANLNGYEIVDAKASNWTSGINALETSWQVQAMQRMCWTTSKTHLSMRTRVGVAMPSTAMISVGSFGNFYFYVGISPGNTSIFTQTLFNAKGALEQLSDR